MKNFIVTHTHRHGFNVYLLKSLRMLGPDDAIEFLGEEFEDNREDEFVDIEEAQPTVIK